MIRRSPVTVVLAVALLAVLAIGGGGFSYLFLREAGPGGRRCPERGARRNGRRHAAGGFLCPELVGLDGRTRWDVDRRSGDRLIQRLLGRLRWLPRQGAAGGDRGQHGGGPHAERHGLADAGWDVDVQVTADLTTLQSDDSRRDGQLSHQGIATSSFPTATFKLTAPIQLAAVPADCVVMTATATGDLTLHGVTKSVQVALQSERSGAVVTVTGSTNIVFADFGFQGPSSFAVLSVRGPRGHGVPAPFPPRLMTSRSGGRGRFPPDSIPGGIRGAHPSAGVGAGLPSRQYSSRAERGSGQISM